MKSHTRSSNVRDEAKALMDRLKAEGRFADATILRRLIFSHMGQANTLADQTRQLQGARHVITSTTQHLRAAMASQAQP